MIIPLGLIAVSLSGVSGCQLFTHGVRTVWKHIAFSSFGKSSEDRPAESSDMAWFVGSLCLIAGIFDLRTHRIPNAITYLGLLVGLAANTAGSFLSEEQQKVWGLVGWEASLQGLIFIGGLMLVCFVLFNIGGGDVKLLTMIASCLGWEPGLEVVLWTFTIGAAVGLGQLVWRVGAWSLLKKVVVWLLASVRLVAWQPLTPQDRELLQPSLYLAPVTALAVFIVMNHWL